MVGITRPTVSLPLSICSEVSKSVDAEILRAKPLKRSMTCSERFHEAFPAGGEPNTENTNVL